MPSARRLASLRTAAAAALLALPAAAPTAGAQAPCADGTLAEYLALGPTGCRLGRVTFANFTLVNEILGTTTNATVFTPSLAAGVFPFRAGAIGIPGFGFQFEELFAAVEIATDEPVAFGHVRSTFRYTFESSVREIRRARVIGAVFVDEMEAPDDLAGFARTRIVVEGGGSTCLDVRRRRTDTGTVFDVADPCEPDAIAQGTVTYEFEAQLARTGGVGRAEGLAGAGVIVAAFRGQPAAAVVPEPATVALLGGGLLAFGVARAARRSRG